MPEGSSTAGSPSLAELGEWELIRRLQAYAPAGQFSDDAALLALDPNTGPLVVNTDVLVEGVHFSDSTTGAEDVGWRAAAANLSDLAAMGCTDVLGLTVGLVAPATTAWSWVEGVYSGLRQALDVHGGVILGGDCSSGQQRLLAITALGRLPATAGIPPTAAAASHAEAIRRGDGRPGDWLVSSGPHGLSRLGLALLQGTAPPNVPAALAQRAIAAHRRPRPRFDVVHALRACQPPNQPWRVGGCDSSDGLAAAAVAIAANSGCQACLDPQNLPLENAMAGLDQARDWCLAGGEDFELLLALTPEWGAALIGTLPGCQLVGQLQQGDGPGGLRWRDGAVIPTELAGFRHFET